MAEFKPADYTFSHGFKKKNQPKDRYRIFVTTDLQYKIAEAVTLTNHKVLHLFQKKILFK